MRIFKIVILVVFCTMVIVYAAIAGIVYGYNRPEPDYKTINIRILKEHETSTDFVSREDVMSLVRSSGIKIKGQHIADVNTLALRKHIEKGNRLIHHVSCYHTPDSSLRIDVTQRTAILRVKSSILGDNYVDGEGVLMPIPRHTSAMHLPLATGAVKKSHIDGLLSLTDFLNRNRYWGDMISQINIRQDGEVELVPECDNHIILLGDFTDIEKKMDHLETFYKDVLPRKGWNTYRYISVKYNNEIIGIK